ncbi:MAG: glycosyltransferase [Acidobacteriota bacterium]|nr:glycosyltransferase [Acidobacteriota bacterium]
MNIAWLLETTAISGRTRAVLALADAIVSRGHRVRLITDGPDLTWRHSSAEWVHVDNFAVYDSGGEDFVVATSLSTLKTANAYYCFGDDEPSALAGVDIAMLAASKILLERYANFAKDITFIGAIVDDEVYRKAAPREHQPPRVLLCGPAQEDGRGIDDGYGAAGHARWFHQKLDLIRVSAWAPSREEPLDSVQEFHVALSTAEMTRLMHSCDIVLAPNERETAFSLSTMEALAAGIPSILAAIPSFLSFDAQNDYALFAPPGNAVEMGERLIEMLDGADVRQRLRSRAREVAEQWRAPAVADRLERFFSERSE